MTGEVYGALCGHTILGRTMQKPEVADDEAFLRGAGVARTAQGKSGVLSNIFSSRTLGLTGELAAEAQPDYLSGLLIGHEIAALKNLYPSTPGIVLIGDPGLCRRYQLALDLYGLGPAAEAGAATEAGLWILAQHAGLLA
jgi:2-dehydro-3-deoxygalactonokinase